MHLQMASSGLVELNLLACCTLQDSIMPGGQPSNPGGSLPKPKPSGEGVAQPEARAMHMIKPVKLLI